MLTKEENELLCRVGPGNPMGDLMRQYWLPVMLCPELPKADGDPMRVRLLGEDLVIFGDTQGRVGMLVECCPHRGASLFFGRNEDSGLRCVYHGWRWMWTGGVWTCPANRRRIGSRSACVPIPAGSRAG